MNDWPPRMAVCVGTVVLRDERVLWIRQAAGASLAGQWSIPWGLVEPNETPEQAALRETHEEAGVTAEVAGLLGYQNLPSPGWLGLVFLCRHAGGEPRPDGHETDRGAYLSEAEMAALPETVDPWCAWIVRRVLRGVYRPALPVTDNPYHPQKAFFWDDTV